MKRKFGCVLLAFVMMLATVPLLGLPAFAEDSVNLLTNVEKQDGKIVVTVSSENEIAVDALSFKMPMMNRASVLFLQMAYAQIIKVLTVLAKQRNLLTTVHG